MKSSGIGGQAVIEGVMMRNRGQYAIAVRKPNGEIEVDVKSCGDVSKRNRFFRLPIVRGVMAFIDSLTLGMSTLQYSASFYDEEAKEGSLEKRLNNITKGHGEKILDVLTVTFSVVLALVIFVLVPMLITSFISPYLQFEHSRLVVSFIEGVLRVLIFILYIVLISRMEDIKRMFMYHGAEHKCINCIEHGRTLTVDNVRRSSKEHKRCGTSFMLNVMLISILLFMVIDVDSILIKLLLRLVLIPVIAGVSYEFTRIAGKTDNKFVNLLSKPGLLMQALTTKEPDDSMIEVGIASVEAVFDWEPFVEGIKNERRAGRAGAVTERRKRETAEKTEKTGQTAKNDKSENRKSAKSSDNGGNERRHERTEERKRETAPIPEVTEEEKVMAPISEEAFRPLEIDISDLFDIKLPEAEADTKKNSKKNAKEQPKEETPQERELRQKHEQEADELLAALDIMFEYHGAKTVTEMSDDPAVTSGENVVFNFDSEAVRHAQDALDTEASSRQQAQNA
ncbi:MAG: DUF1385 domain-containing protein [Lachnospiraceae bacterium]|nr:DUF1385 domain-containing protein [Lachnospiraceae bacterium]